MARKKGEQYRIVVKFEEGTKRTVYSDDEGRPLTEETWEAEWQHWEAEKSLRTDDLQIEWVYAYRGNRRIA